MTIHPLLIDADVRAKVDALVSYAKLRENWYVIHRTSAPNRPGENPNHVIHLNSYRCVFSFTDFNGSLYRHLSISVPGDKYPNDVAAFSIAELFGFDGEPNKWLLHISEEEHAVVLAQEVASP